MKVKVDDVEILEISEIRKKVIAHEIPSEDLEADLKRRLSWVITHKYERCMEKIKNQWVPKLKERGHQSIPLDDDALAEMIFADPDYKNRSARIIEEQSKTVKK